MPHSPLIHRRFAWYGRLSTKDKQDPTLAFPSQLKKCDEKVGELGGSIVCQFTDQERGRRDDRVGWSELLSEAKQPDIRRFDAVIIYATSRLSRDLFHALSYEREMKRAGVEVFYALTAGDQTSPEGRLIRHMFQALDQFEVEKLGREVRRGQTENTRQGFRNGGRAPYGYRLKREPHPDPARAKAGDRKSRLVPHAEQAPVIAEIFTRFISGSGYKEIANHLNRPGRSPVSCARRFKAQHRRQVVEEHPSCDAPESRLYGQALLEPARLSWNQAGRRTPDPPSPRRMDRGRATTPGTGLRRAV